MARLDLVGAGLVATEAPSDDRLTFLDQGEQPGHLGFAGHEFGQDPRQPDRLRAEAGSGESRGVDDGQHRPQPSRQFLRRRDPVRDAGGLDLAFGADETLRHGRFGHQERPGHLRGGQPAQQPQGERHPDLGGQSRVAAGEDQAQPVVRHDVPLSRIVLGGEHGNLAEQLAAPRVAAQPVDEALACGGGDPATGIGRQPVLAPLDHGDGERLLQRVLGEVDVTAETDEGGQRSA